jgi:H+/Cl- antiporter ClcA
MITAFIFGALGALSGEVLKLWEQFRKMTDRKFRQLVKSPKFWTMAIILTGVGGLGGIFANEEGKSITLKLSS